MKCYPKYKDTDVGWIGDIPKYWKLVPLKYLLKDGNEGIKIGPFGSSLKLVFMKDEGFKVYGQENVINDNFKIGKRFIDEKKFNELIVYQIHPGDMIITMMGTTGKAKVVPKGVETGIMDSHLIRLRFNEKTTSLYISILINDSYYIYNQIKMQSKGSIMEGLNSSIIKSLLVALPPLTEQTQIANFLDRKTKLIDTLIEKKQKQIDLLKEQRAAVINHAVTKGLNPDVPMKDSGVEWIGEIPEHWDTSRLDYEAFVIDPQPDHRAPPIDENGFPYLGIRDINEDGTVNIATARKVSERAVKKQELSFRLDDGDIVFCKVGTLGLPRHFIKPNCRYAISATLVIIKVKNRNNNKYIKYLLENNSIINQINYHSTGSTRQALGIQVIRRFKLATPKIDEQIKIVKYLDIKTGIMNDQLNKINRQIELLKEYRTTLISEAVTGKIDVRDEVLV